MRGKNIVLCALGLTLLVSLFLPFKVNAQNSIPCLIQPGGYANPDYGYYWDYNGFLGMDGLHQAQDFTNNGVPFEVLAVGSGSVTRHELYNTGSGGVMEFTLDPPFENYKVQYVHMQSGDAVFKEWDLGDHLIQSQVLGIADGSGSLSSGVHLHFKIWKDGKTIDPMTLMDHCTPTWSTTTPPSQKRGEISWWKNVPLKNLIILAAVLTVLLVLGWVWYYRLTHPFVRWKKWYKVPKQKREPSQLNKWSWVWWKVLGVFWEVVIVGYLAWKARDGLQEILPDPKSGFEIRLYIPNTVYYLIPTLLLLWILIRSYLRKRAKRYPYVLLPEPEIVEPTPKEVKRKKRWRKLGLFSGILGGILIFNLMGARLTPAFPTPPPPDLPTLPAPPADMQDIPSRFAEIVTRLGPQIIQLSKEENVPPESTPTLWLKEAGGWPNNPDNGEGLCGFYSKVNGGKYYFTPGPISDEEIVRQLRLCAQEFHEHAAKIGLEVSFETTDFDILGPIYMAYNGNIDCHGGKFPSWREHPYVMNGYDSEHQGMVARDGRGGCVSLKVIGAIPAHIRVGQLLRGNNLLLEEAPPPTITPESTPTPSSEAVEVVSMGNSWMVTASYNQGASLLVTGNGLQSLSSHWDEIKTSGGVCVANGSFFEPDEVGSRTFPEVKGESKFEGVKTHSSKYEGYVRMLYIWDNEALVTEYTYGWADVAPLAIGGLNPVIEYKKETTRRTLIGIKDNGKTVILLLTVDKSVEDAVGILTSQGVEEKDIVLLDGGGSTQLICGGESKISSTRPIPQGIGIIKK